MFISKRFLPHGKLTKIVCPWALVRNMFDFYTDLAFLPSLIDIEHIPDKNAALLPDENVTLHANISKDCCCREDYNSCFTSLSPEFLNPILRHDDCDDDLGGVWNGWFDIPIKNIPDNEIVVGITITPYSNRSVLPYISNNVTIGLQGTLVHTLCCC